MGIISTVVAFIASLFFVVTQPTALERFSQKDQQKIRDAAPDFVVAGGRFWDRSVDRRQREARAKKGLSEREAQALGISEIDPCGTVPRWFAATDGQSLSSDLEIVRATAKSGSALRPNDKQFVCEEVLPEGLAVAYSIEMRPRSSANRPLSPGQSIPMKPTRIGPYLLENHGLKKTGDAVRPEFVLDTGRTINYMGQTLAILRIPGSDELGTDILPVSAEQLAQAIVDGQVKLTEWRWDRKTVQEKPTSANPKGRERAVITWIPKDVTPKPAPANESTK